MIKNVKVSFDTDPYLYTKVNLGLNKNGDIIYIDRTTRKIFRFPLTSINHIIYIGDIPELSYLLKDKESICLGYKYKWKYTDDERPINCCYDCKMPYNQFPDLIIPDELWDEINPTYREGAGILCPTCITNRLNHIGKWYKHNLYILEIKK